MTSVPGVLRTDDRRGDRRYRRLLALAAAALFWEQLWPRLWPSACVLGAFLALALLDVLPVLPDWLHAGILALFVAGFVAAAIWAWPGFRGIHRGAARSRLERDNDLTDHPLAALEDRLAAGRGDRLAEALWRRHQERMAAMVGGLRVRLPRPGIARYDPWGSRVGVLLMLIVALVAARQDAGPRLLRALDPGLGAGRQAPLVELWITPPAYTGAAPLFFTTGGPPAATADGSAVRIPRGSTALVRAQGVGRVPVLAIGSADTRFASLAGDGDGKQAWRAETTIDQGDRIRVRAGRRELATWPIEVVPDRPPTAAFVGIPAAAGNGLLSLAYEARDDYGVAAVAAVIEPADDRAQTHGDDPTRLELPLTTPGAASVSGESLQDLSEHPLAGRSVRLHLEASDAAGQIGLGETVEIVLPERTFAHPVARAIVELRKQLSRSEERGAVAAGLAAVASQPERFGNDAVVSLSLAVAKSRLDLDTGPRAIPSVRDLLWQTALRIEQGDVPLAERQVEEARQRLSDALQHGGGQSEIERLTDELQRALDRYLAAAAAELARRGATPMPVDRQSRMLHSDDLKELIETARQLARTGGREGAMQMLAELQRMLDDIRSGLRSRGASRDAAEAQELMRALRDLADRQHSLLDESFRRLRDSLGDGQRGSRGQGQRQERGRAPDPGAKAGASEQQALRQELGELMLRLDGFLGVIPAPLGEADQAMRGAVEGLQRGRFGDAVANQSQAADALGRALDAARQTMAQRLRGMIGLSGQEGEGGGSGDVFGRSPDGQRGFATGPLKIPDRSELQRAQEILEELRRRAAERSRPRPELDYIDRLLRRF